MQEEKKPMSKEEYRKKIQDYAHVRKQVNQDPLRLQYHLQPPMGWLNDPNGLCQIGDTYHIYFQYTPFNPEGGTGLWGHMTTKDFVHYQEQEPAIYPDTAWDANGAYSGSALKVDDTYYFFYTGNVKYEDQAYDYITDGREQNIILTTSKDGYEFTDKKLIMSNDDFPKDMSKHVRDPKIIKKSDRYYMVLGGRELQDHGCVLLFESTNLIDWHYKSRFKTKERFGYMWECPNLVEIAGMTYLIACPQDQIEHNGKTIQQNLCGYFPLSNEFEKEDELLMDLKQLDDGFDFYAPQVFQDDQGRVILLGWMGMPDCDYGNEPTIAHGWQHALTIPRELYVTSKGSLAQRPVKELRQLRKNKKTFQFERSFCEPVATCFEMKIHLDTTEEFQLILRESAKLVYQKGTLRLLMEACGEGRTKKEIQLDHMESIHVLSDTSSLEIFINGGEHVFTTRVYDSMHYLYCNWMSKDSIGCIELYELEK